jgi:hypothetical protein
MRFRFPLVGLIWMARAREAKDIHLRLECLLDTMDIGCVWPVLLWDKSVPKARLSTSIEHAVWLDVYAN